MLLKNSKMNSQFLFQKCSSQYYLFLFNLVNYFKSSRIIFPLVFFIICSFFNSIASGQSNQWIATYTKGILIFNENGVTLTSIKKIENYFHLNVLPNPSNGNTYVNFKIRNPSNVRMFVSDYTGKNLFDLFDGKIQPGFYSILLDLTSSPRGIYFCNLFSEGTYTSIKLIVTH